MPCPFIEKIKFNENTPIKNVLERFNETAVFTDNKGLAIVVDAQGKCKGIATDGDIRRKLLEGIGFDSPIFAAMNREYSYVNVTDSRHKILRQFDKNSKIKCLPVLDGEQRPVDLYVYSSFFASTLSGEKIIRARVPVRISFSGGGTDMSKYINHSSTAVLSSTINKYCTASVIIRDDEEIHIVSKDLNKKYSTKKLDNIEFGDNLDLIKFAIKIMQPIFGFDLETLAEFEPGTGLGGSSAVVVAVLGALNYFRNEHQLDIYQLADVAYQVERIDMKIQGGWQDQYAVTFGGFSWIEFYQNEVIVNPLRLQRETILELEYNLMLFRIGKMRSSSEIQERHINGIVSSSDTIKVFDKMKELSLNMKEALLKGNVKTFGDLLHKSWLLKKEMHSGVTNPLIEECYNIARTQGALGGKLLGAGGSGYLLVYASPLYQKQIKEALAEKGAGFESFKFSQNGLEVWSTKK